MFSRKARIVRSPEPLVVYAGLPSKDLSVLYAAMRTECDEPVAQAVLQAIFSVDEACKKIGTTWLGPFAEVRIAIGHVLRDLGATEVKYGKGTARVSPKNSNTARTILAHLKYAYDVAKVIGMYEYQPLVGKSGYPYFIVNRIKRPSPRYVLDNPDLPDIIRKYGRLANITRAEAAIYEIILCSGARISEVCSLNIEGSRDYASIRRVSVRNKGNGSSNTKSLLLSEEAVMAIDAYVCVDFKKNDPILQIRHPENKVEWPLSRYIDLFESEGVNLELTPLFYNRNRMVLTPKAFRYSWQKIHSAVPMRLRRSLPLVRRLHDLRHWRINYELDLINSSHEHYSPQHIRALKDFVDIMGWRSEMSLEHYDHKRIAIAVLKADREKRSGGNLVRSQLDLKERLIQIEKAEAAGLGFRESGLR